MSTAAAASGTLVKSRRRRGQIYVALAAVAWSSAGVLQRQLTADTVTQVAGRAVFAALAVFAYLVVVERGRVVHSFRSVGVAGLWVALCVAVASSGFMVALNHTTVARVMFILALAPVLAAAMGWVFLGESISRRSMVAMLIAMAGVALMVGSPGAGDLTGDALAFLCALAFAASIVITRHRRDVSMAPAAVLSQVLVVVVLAAFAAPSQVDAQEALWLALFGTVQIGLGFVLLTAGARLIPAAQVGLIVLLEIVLAPIWVWIAVSERPDTATVIGGAIVLAAIVIQTTGAEEPEEEGAPVVPP